MEEKLEFVESNQRFFIFIGFVITISLVMAHVLKDYSREPPPFFLILFWVLALAIALLVYLFYPDKHTAV